MIINIFCLNSFASTEVLLSNGERYNLPDFSDYVQDKDYFIAYGNSTNYTSVDFFILIPYDYKTQTVYTDKTSSYVHFYLLNYKGDFPSSNYFTYVKRNPYYTCYSTSTSWSIDYFEDRDSGRGFSTSFYGIYTTQNITGLKNNDVVFQPTPQVVGEVRIPEIQSVEEIPQAMSKVLEMIIPVGLIVLSIGLLIYLVRLVISRAT